MTKHAILRYETQGALYHYNFSSRQFSRGLTQSLFHPEVSDAQTLEILAREGCSDVSVRKIKNLPVDGAYSAPLKLFLDVTNFCNLGCAHCLSSSSSKNHDSLTFETIEDIARQCEDAGVFYVKIGGGEPLLYPRIFELIDMLNAHSLDVSLTTNGTRVTPQTAEALRDRNVKISVSVDGLQEQHEKIRGRGTYTKALNALDVLKASDANVTIRTTLFPANIQDMYGLVELAYEKNIPLKIRRAKPSGRAIDNDLVMVRPTMEYYRLLNYLNQHTCIVDIEDIMHSGDDPTKDLIVSSADCGAATRSIHIDQNGNVSPCVFLGQSFIAGNIFESSLLDVWRNTQQFNELRNLASHEDCYGCRREQKCHNECPAIKLYATGSLTGKDPSCLRDMVAKFSESAPVTVQKQ